MTTSPFPTHVVLDTCVLISNPVRKLFLRLAQQGCLFPLWGDYIGVEWQRNASRLWEQSPESLKTHWEAIQHDFPLSNMGVVQPFEIGLKRSDPKDWHVIACGRAAQKRYPQAQIAVITWNLKDFNRSELRDYGLQLFTPDQFLSLLWETHASTLVELFKYFLPDALAIGQDPQPIDIVLKKERLFRLNKLYQARLENIINGDVVMTPASNLNSTLL